MRISKKKMAAIIWVLFYPKIICMGNDNWKPVKISKQALCNTTLTTKTLSIPTDVVCAMTTSRFSWASLFCFKEEGICQITSFIAVPYESPTMIPDPIDCMTKLDGCIYNGAVVALGYSINTPAPQCQLTCKNGQMVPLPLFPPSGKCDSPFSQVGSYGCFYFDGSKGLDYCSSRLYCQSIGGDLWIFPTNQTLAFINPAALAIGNLSNHDVSLGIYGKGTDFFWLDGTQVNKSSDMWNYPYPSSSTTNQDGVCGRSSRDSGIINLKTQSCTDNQNVLCQMRTQP